MSNQTKPVIFLLPDGTEVSNDPYFNAKGLQGQLDEAAANREAELRAQIRAEIEAELAAAEDEDDDEEDTEEDLDSLTGPQLKELAAERGVDISGLSKVGEVREAIRAAAQG